MCNSCPMASLLDRRVRLWSLGFALAAGIAASPAMGAPFQDLDFEQAVLQPDPNYPAGDAYAPISAAAAFPGWVVTEGGTTLTDVEPAPFALDETSVALISDSPSFPDFQPPQGEYAVNLYGCSLGAQAPPGEPTTAAISQTGDIPTGSVSIRFLVATVPGSVVADPFFFVNGTSVPVYPLEPSGSAELWAGDISPYAGTTATITLEAAGVLNSFPADEDDFNLDAISFSTQPVPEPVAASGMILACAALLLLRTRTSAPLCLAPVTG